MQTPQPQRLLDIDPTPGNPRNSEGSLVTLADGQLLFAYSRFVGGARDDSASYIACRRSPDGGSTWSDDETLVENVGTMNTMSVSFLRLRSGAIALFYLVRTGDERTGLQTIDLHMRTSVDEGATWSEAVCCTSPAAFYVVNNDRVIQLASGRLLAPAARHAFFDGSHLAPAHSMCFLSDDEGATWRGSATVLPPPEGSHAGLQEPGVIELTDGRVMMYIRTDQGCVYRSYSTDGGDTW